jgi:signal transduction histidine kinase
MHQQVLRILVRLQSRLLALLVLVVGVALGTVAVVARASTTAEFERYVQDNRQDMQVITQKIAATTGDRFVVTTTGGRVIVDSAGELFGQSLTPDQATDLGIVPIPPDRTTTPSVQPMADARPIGDVLFVGRKLEAASASPNVSTPSGPNVFWTRAVSAPPFDAAQVGPRAEPTAAIQVMPFIDDREQIFVTAVTRSLVVGVMVGGVAAVVLALLFARGILRPIGALTRAAELMERGDLGQRVAVHSRDEIGQLGKAFNSMADVLARNEQLRRTLVGDVAHELRTPLTNLRGYLEALQDGIAEPTPETIESLCEEALLLTRLVDDLQDLTLSDAGALSLRLEPVDASAMVHSSALAVAARARQQGIDLLVEPMPRLPFVCADPRRIAQVLRNLLTNALTRTPAGGSVRLSAHLVADSVRIDVRDTGCGIAAEHVPNVFERFYRADPSRARATGGTGLGLALVKQFVTAHGGSVSVVSVLDQGSCFSFTLPVYPSPVVEKA